MPWHKGSASSRHADSNGVQLATLLPVNTGGSLKTRKPYVPSLSCFPNEAQQRRCSKAVITELQKKLFLAVVFSKRRLYSLPEACTKQSLSAQSPHTSQWSNGPCQTAEWGSEKHPAFPVWEQAAIALLWPHKYFMHSLLRDITVSMQQGLPLFYREV